MGKAKRGGECRGRGEGPRGERVDRIREIVDRDYISEGDLRREVGQNIRRLIEIGTYRGLRHRRGLPAKAINNRTSSPFASGFWPFAGPSTPFVHGPR